MSSRNFKTCQNKIQRNNETVLEERILSITKSLSKPYFNTILNKLAKSNPENAQIICDYIIAEQTEFNIKESTKEGKIKVIVWLSNYLQNKNFMEMTKQDILDYLNSLRKSLAEDPSSKWIGSYNGRQMILLKFFRWLYSPNEPDSNKRGIPLCMQGIKKLPRREKTSYKPSDIWNMREHAIFLKYCPLKRDRCYHAMANDTSARPHELLNLRINDIKFYKTEDGKQYAEIRIIGGKTGSRTIPLIDSIPYLKEWLQQEHPSAFNSDSYLFTSIGKNFGLKLTYDGLCTQYTYYKNKYFPYLLHDPSVPESDKSFIRNMLTKPWNLYVFRHSALTEKSQIYSEAILRNHAGWSMSSDMPQVYIHLSDESSKVILQKKGIIKKEDSEISDALKTKQCPHCFETNPPDSKFCFKCKMVLAYQSYHETIEEQKRKEDHTKTTGKI